MIYEGSELFKPVADKLDLRIDQLNFLIAEIMAIGFGLLYRSYLPPSVKNTTLRHVVAILAGFAIGYFFYGTQLWHVFFQVTVCFLALDLCPRQYVHLFIFTFCMSYLSALHLYRRFYDYANYTLDVTTQMMIMTQKLTALGFAFYDGMRPVEKLNDDQKSQAIKTRPHIIEFLSYCFNFQGIIVGPLVYYQDYIQYVDGTSVLKHQKSKSDGGSQLDKIEQPPVAMVVAKKVLGTCAVMFVWFTVASVYPIITNLSAEMLAMPIWYRFLYFQVSAGSQRTKFYIAWLLGDAVNNASGLGFNGYHADGHTAKWDLVTNIDVIAIEKATSIKIVFDRWNIQTQLWLRRIAYDRLHTGKTLGVFVLSAFWHGFYPGYYFCFIVSAFFVYAGRGIRRKVRPFFQANQVTKMFYAFITWLITIFCINYAATAFDLYETEVCIRFYNSWYWCLHIASITILLVLPGGSTKKPRPAAATATDATAAAVGETTKTPEEIAKQTESKSD